MTANMDTVWYAIGVLYVMAIAGVLYFLYRMRKNFAAKRAAAEVDTEK